MTPNRIWKIAGYTAGAIVLLIAGAILYITGFLLRTNPEPLNVEVTPARVEAGRYLANHVMVCIDCHSTRDWTLFSGPIVPGTEGSGGEIFSKEMGFPGKFVSPNITPYALRSWTDAELFRAITQGIDKRHMPLYPVMPFPYYGKLDREDILSIIAYLRTLPEIASTPDPSYTGFPFSLIMYLIPKKPVFEPKPDRSDTLAYGKYLVTAAVCIDCHTTARKGMIDRSLAFTGRREFKLQMKTVVSANITSSVDAGIGRWSPEAFIARFRAYDPLTNPLPKAENVGFNTVMPWSMYAGMDPTDLLAMHHYLQTLEPVETEVKKINSSRISRE
jgi:mono/diheme cytochrome c family protein